MSRPSMSVENKKVGGSISMKLSAWRKIREYKESNNLSSDSQAAEIMILSAPVKKSESKAS
jgi:hypothetical protein